MAAKAGKPGKRWSKDVTEHSTALRLEKGVFTLDDPTKIAASLKRSAEASTKRKSDPYRSAMSMLTFYINRAGNACLEPTATGWNSPRTSYASFSAASQRNSQSRERMSPRLRRQTWARG